MSFHTIPFLIFFFCSFFLYRIVPDKAKNAVLLILSYIFYFCGTTPYYLPLLWLGTSLTYAVGRKIPDAKHKKAVLWLGILLNLVCLCFFKYSHYLFPSLGEWCASTGIGYTAQVGGAVRLILPLGISYYTFQVIGYLTDVYRGDVAPEKNIIDFALFVSFFPQVVCGPIGRAKELLPQFKAPRTAARGETVRGLQLMLFGFFKKIATADLLAMVINTVYGNVSQYSGAMLLFCTLLYSMYLYCDFSGYSDIARGCGKVFGIELRENFNAPYFSTSVGQFWSRWHISLSSWLKDYIYIPLGGNRHGKFRHYLNIVIVFVISGLWHGVGMTFFVWGVLHALYRVCETLCWKLIKKPPEQPTLFRRTVSTARVFLLVTFSYIFFRAASINDAFTVIKRIFTCFSPLSFGGDLMGVIGSSFNATPILKYAYLIFCVITLLVVIYTDWLRSFRWEGKDLTYALCAKPTAVRWIIYYALLFAVAAAFIMENGNYVGNISFAYGGF